MNSWPQFAHVEADKKSIRRAALYASRSEIRAYAGRRLYGGIQARRTDGTQVTAFDCILDGQRGRVVGHDGQSEREVLTHERRHEVVHVEGRLGRSDRVDLLTGQRWEYVVIGDVDRELVAAASSVPVASQSAPWSTLDVALRRDTPT
jgi:hypothetical protein